MQRVREAAYLLSWHPLPLACGASSGARSRTMRYVTEVPTDTPSSTPSSGEPFALASRAADTIARRSGQKNHDVAVVLGSGWGDAAAAMGEVVSDIPTTEIEGFPTPTVPGHTGSVRSVRIAGTSVLILTGRVHLYEGHAPAAIVHAVRTAIFTGCRSVVLTNAAGSINPSLNVGQPVLITDHLNLTGASPLTGPEPPAPHPIRFVDLTETYSRRLRDLARSVEPALGEGVYAGVHGPHFETPAEISMLQTLGADLVGMSTVLEAIAAHHLGAEVLGISLVTNLAAGLNPEPLDHAEVLATGAEAGPRMAELLGGIVGALGAE